MGKPHPSFFSMLQQLNEEALVANAEKLTGKSPLKEKKKTDDTDKRIERIVDQYDEYKDAGEIPEFLRAQRCWAFLRWILSVREENDADK